MAQAFPQAYAQPNKGTLLPGQTISVNKYTVQVERYLSQGGFAHVYLVRTATPIYNTTHHVLKRIAVPSEVMLTEVKKEVDIMRILKGHPNIVYLIDAAWHRLQNGTYEVFILMEFCAGGGIIDMMNRRLRERLTEQEILTIFVDVCEGLAAMHNLKPPLLHRDLKVENILQASADSYKLCDFGSATPVQRVPTNTQEMRALEADLNRHTTLQYRAPEMVDVYLRRAVDERSDVWALGVLLYKLCYYTTPFEEHGPLAILNVQYKIPPYPVYSAQMNALIASMLREHGTQRPSVFEVLAHVHRLRGTKSRFTYTIPSKEPLSPRAAQSPLRALSPNIVSASQVQANPLDDLVSYKSQQQTAAKNTGVEARDRVLEAIAPMRRGRPPPGAPSPPASPKKDRAFELDMKFGAEEDRAWRGVRGQKSGPGIGTNTGGATDAWGLGAYNESKKGDRTAFENDFSASFGKGFGDVFEPAKPSVVPLGAPIQPSPSPKLPPQFARPQVVRATGITSKDAFDGLGLSVPAAPQTLGEARKSRTGLASFGMSSMSVSPNPPQQYLSGLGSSNTMYRPPSSHDPLPSPSPRPQPQPQSQTLSPVPPPAQWRAHSKEPSGFLPAEERFPSLEELDREFVSPPLEKSGLPMAHIPTQPAARPSSRASYIGNIRGLPNGTAGASTMDTGAGRSRFDGVRSQHVTGAAMREAKLGAGRSSGFSRAGEPGRDADREPRGAMLQSRPSLARRHQSSFAVRADSRADSMDHLSAGSSTNATPALPPRPTPSPRTEPRDWLTGADEEVPVHRTPVPQPQPVLRESPSKRASFFERSPITLQKPLEAESVVEAFHPTTELEKFKADLKWDWEKSAGPEKEQEQEQERQQRSSKLPGRTKATITGTGTGPAAGRAQGLKLPPVDTTGASRQQPSPSGLTDNWSPLKGSSSSSDDGPEDLNGYAPRGGSPEKNGVRRSTKAGDGKPSERRRRKGRQSSVHDLVDLWDGGLGADKDKEKVKPAEREPEPVRKSTTLRQADKRRSVIMPAPTLKPPLVAAKPRSESPKPLVDIPLPRSLPIRPPSSPHRRQPSATAARQAPIPAPVPAPSAGRSRPQSMFLTSLAKTSSAPPTEGVSSSAVPQGLTLPPDARARRAERRSSISDMVQHFEAIGGSKAKADAASPSAAAAAVRFPRLSPPAKAGQGLPARTSPRQTEVSGLPARRSPLELDRRPSAQPEGAEAPAGKASPPEVRSPSPERPYQGVSRLIDRWNRAVDDTGPGARPARRVGVVAEAGRGR